ncbi:glycosyltransferase family 39 protein [Thelephora terrestris]|uniref:Dolichyl-phosphate-mannose--protein mannosyltransferase n=1 Tax=Thelephora terrestris TaxID=56493 RepID=A0A9P6HDY3_9AGAM|nr:glycosyltransferase family 39 protein [Thelephora terrestris]
MENPRVGHITVTVLTVLAFIVRFAKLNHPDQVVFDEVHFGKFAAYYLRREYYFDVHPPFAKLLLALAGWFVGFEGNFDFQNIGDSYTTNNVPYWGMRALPAILGSLTVPIVYYIMQESGYSTIIAAFSAIIILFDNAHVTQSRLILLDAILIFFMSLTIYSYIKFRKYRYHEFTFDWWAWMLATGFFMACTWSSKVNGILTVVAIGIAVMVDLWDLLDWRKSDNERITKHFLARVVGFIVVPFIFYLIFFWIHFTILTHSGTGDGFMSPAFQETLIGNELLMNSHEIRYFDTITIKHVNTKNLLHSHPQRYPRDYPDNRISSQGQQVTGYPHEDENNNWMIIPTKALPETGRGRIVRHNDIIQLLHVQTDSFLLTHDVASPGFTTHQEFSTLHKDQMQRYNETLFQLRLTDGYDGQVLTTKANHFKLQHAMTTVFMMLPGHELPDWAFNQQEVNGHRHPEPEGSEIWVGDTIVAGDQFDELDERLGNQRDRKPKSMNFFSKFIQLQDLMFAHNAGLTASHPYASSPNSWPFAKKGISFWTENETHKQIYLVGNLVGWWTSAGAVFLIFGIFPASIFAERRNIPVLSDSVTHRLWNSCGFFVVIWVVHYLPFFLFSRQLFLHHYLPAHLASALIAGAVLNFICTETVNYPISYRGLDTPPKPREYADVGVKGAVIVGIFTVLQFSLFVFMAPLTYGTPGLDGDDVNRHRLRGSWTLHFASKETIEL